jgi:hypothetical protein
LWRDFDTAELTGSSSNADAVAKIKEKATPRAMDFQGIIDGIKRSGIT